MLDTALYALYAPRMDLAKTDQQLAHAAVKKAVREGRLRQEPCVVCWALPSVAHHPRGYDEDHRLDIVWLCARCHERVHGRSIASATATGFRSIRESKGLSLSAVARGAGMNKGRLSIIERGVSPTEEEATAIWRVLSSDGTPDRLRVVPLDDEPLSAA